MQKMNPWTPTIIALMFSLVAVIESVGQNNMRYLLFFVNVPWIFMFVTFCLSQLQKENEELRTRLDALEGNVPTEETPGNKVVSQI